MKLPCDCGFTLIIEMHFGITLEYCGISIIRGSSYLFIFFNLSYLHGRFYSIYQTETLAVLFCFNYIETLNTTATKFLKCSDSPSVLKKLRQPGRTVTLSTLRILQKLETLHAKAELASLIWVKGHFGCEGSIITNKDVTTTTISDLKIQYKQ